MYPDPSDMPRVQIGLDIFKVEWSLKKTGVYDLVSGPLRFHLYPNDHRHLKNCFYAVHATTGEIKHWYFVLEDGYIQHHIG